MACKHTNFGASVKVARLEDTGRFMAEVRVKCEDCGEPFQFLGLEAGLDMQGARVSLDGLEALLSIAPNSQVMSPLLRLAAAARGAQ
ncbi:hypothetical protein [Oceanicola sp. S124]|uniref:hypothetical protein n=1 Tax=Oceanicola sp. S124 TaxID=1042378 RepID=UPI0002559C7C|nr:hypothetical protein [Oceanicola sp. S124]